MSREIYTNPSNGRLYYLIQSSEWSAWEGAAGANSWTSAALYSGGNLVTVNDIDEYNWLLGTFSLFDGPPVHTSEASPTPAWIGLTDRNTEGQLEWMSREPLNQDLRRAGEYFSKLLYPSPTGNNTESDDYGYLVRPFTEIGSNSVIGPFDQFYWGLSTENEAYAAGYTVESAIVEMEPGIFIEAKNVEYILPTNFYHLYLVYRDSSGNERVIRGEPSGDDDDTLRVQADLLLRDTFDIRKAPQGNPLAPVDRLSRKVNLGSRNADDVWYVMKQQAQNIAVANLDYRALNYSLFRAQNSNSVIASVLHSVGIDIDSNLPIGFPSIKPFPGADNLLDIRTRLKGQNGARDIIYGGEGGGVLWGQDGRDVLVGEGGNNKIYGGDGNDLITTGGNGKNRISGGKGADKIVLAEDARDVIYIRPNEGLDSIRNFSIGEDRLVLMGGLKIEDLEFKETGGYTLITTGTEKLVALYGVSSDVADSLF